jgi:site-specific recombinase XerD
MNKPPKRLLDQVREKIRIKHYSIRTEQAYVSWIKRFILFHDKRHPNEMGKQEIEAFLTHLAKNLNVASSTQNQAFNALLFLYNQVLDKALGDKINATRAKKPRRLPTVMTNEEAMKVINNLSGSNKLMAKLLYGSGLRLMECLRLRVKDVDFGMHQIMVRDEKGKIDRVTLLPESVMADLKEQLERVKAMKMILTKDTEKYTFPMLCQENIRMPTLNGVGNMFSRQKACLKIQEPAQPDGIIFMKTAFKKPLKKRSN